ncbi:COQ9 family protein [Parasphingopyxis sp. GrpM-11]|uniref:COQ9 family protein n=2 Tax=Parasphingopyxis marina TaxID=2761622 RepID=A0A842HT78_9SPHN|nr:COQ9 family protein [Parasphingopyxis marina]MBC2776222.1 COQ9 family protein [Parasphingopyxis marina]
MAEPLPQDPTLDEMRTHLAPRIAAHAAFDGWSDAAVERAAEELEIDPDQARLAFPKGAADMIDAWFAGIDAEMAAAFSAQELAAMPVHKRIRAAVLKRIEIARPAREALRRALAILAMPQNMPLAAKLSWRSADAMWRLAGDTATDFNHYSKRGILAGVYGSTIMAWLDDESEGEAETIAFLDRRLGNVADFETFKKRLAGDPDQRFSVTRFLGRLRYPGR